jgi:hypothetical protein
LRPYPVFLTEIAAVVFKRYTYSVYHFNLKGTSREQSTI